MRSRRLWKIVSLCVSVGIAGPFLRLGTAASAQDAKSTKSTKSIKTTKAAEPAKPPVTPPLIESDAKAALAKQWVTWTPSHRWETCLRALDLATQGSANYPEALRILSLGYGGGSRAKNPYDVPPADADVFWDWLTGASRSSLSVSSNAELDTAFQQTTKVIKSYYASDNQELMNRVDANFTAGNPRRAIFELLQYQAKAVRKAEVDFGAAQKTAQAAQVLAATASTAALNKFDECIGKLGDSLPVSKLKECVGDAPNAAATARSAADGAAGLESNASKVVDSNLSALESIRLCYASVDYRKKVVDYVAQNFRNASK